MILQEPAFNICLCQLISYFVYALFFLEYMHALSFHGIIDPPTIFIQIIFPPWLFPLYSLIKSLFSITWDTHDIFFSSQNSAMRKKHTWNLVLGGLEFEYWPCHLWVKFCQSCFLPFFSHFSSFIKWHHYNVNSHDYIQLNEVVKLIFCSLVAYHVLTVVAKNFSIICFYLYRFNYLQVPNTFHIFLNKLYSVLSILCNIL